jgi:hypothetical protein
VYAVCRVDDTSVGDPGTRACSTDRRSVRAIAVGQHELYATDGRPTIGNDIETDAQCKR